MTDRQREIDALLKGETVTFRPVGNSMSPRICSRQLVTVSPELGQLSVGDIVFCRCEGRILLHLISAQGRDGRYQISNNRGHVNGWTSIIYGRVVKVED